MIFWFPFVQVTVRITLASNLFTKGPAFSLRVSPSYEMAPPACLDHMEKFAVGRSYGMVFPSLGLLFFSLLVLFFILNPFFQQGDSGSMPWLVMLSSYVKETIYKVVNVNIKFVSVRL